MTLGNSRLNFKKILNIIFSENPSIGCRISLHGHTYGWTDRQIRRILCFVDHASLYNQFQMKTTRCTLLLSILILTSLHVSGNNVPIIRTTTVSMRHWYYSFRMSG